MPRIKLDKNCWFFFSIILLICYAFLHILHWRLMPYHMDIFYHLHTAWGFIKAEGYSGWDFWEFAPYGRIHIYPPIFHIILAFLIKIGCGPILLAKFFQTTIPILFLIIFWHVIKRNYNKRLGLFVLITISSSFSFYFSLINYTPAAMALIFGLLSIDQLFRNKLLRAVLTLTISFYTHIGVSWFFTISFILFGLFNKKYFKMVIKVIMLTLALSVPVVWKQIAGFRAMSFHVLKEMYTCEFKTIDYILALLGLILSWKKGGQYRLFIGLFLASLVFVSYPYRFFSAQGYLPIIVLSAVFLEWLYEKIKLIKTKSIFIILIIYISILSPTLIMGKDRYDIPVRRRIYYFDSAFLGLMFPGRNMRTASNIIWLPEELLKTADLIKKYSAGDDIIYCQLSNVSVSLGSISGRASSNGLLPEIIPLDSFDPILVSKIIIAPRDEEPLLLQNLIDKYKLIKIGDNKLFIMFQNPLCKKKAKIRKASYPFLFMSLYFDCFMKKYDNK